MKRGNLLFILALAAVFSFQGFDVPAFKSNPKTCCGRLVCQCKHAPGAFCPMGHGAHAFKQQPVHQKAPGFAKAPCSGDTSKTALAGFCKDFNAVPEAAFPFVPRFELLSLASISFPRALSAGTPDRPPKLFAAL
ncbi:MAG TPA: hypothetical protein VL688_05025 [Verrucomicrobiae bacterium]|nr:hypothetical protein [Verrucomicrobiae bacterium]